MSPRRFWSQLLVLVGLFLLARQMASCWAFTVDDSFITYRYSQHLAAGVGPTWNPGERPLEGYTTFLWMIVMTVPHLLGLDPVLFGRLASLACTAGSTALIFLLCRRLQRMWGIATDDLLPMAGVALFVAWDATAIHSISGMETAFFTFLLTAFFYCAMLCAEALSPSRLTLLSLSALLAGLTRPEGNFVALVAAGTLLVLLPKAQRSALAKALLLYLVPALLYYAWRYHYYGHLFPLPFYVKTRMEPFAGLPEVVKYLKSLALPLLGVAFPGLLARADRRLLPAALPALGVTAFFIIPQHQMGYESRYLYPLTPLLLAVSMAGLSQTLAMLAPWWNSLTRRRRQLLFAFVALVAMVMGSEYLSHGMMQTLAGKRDYGTGLGQAHVALGKYLHNFPGGAPRPLVGFNDAGAIPYFSGWRGLDFWGLNDETIALKGKHEPAYSDYILGRRPDLVVLGSTSATSYKPTFPWEIGLYRRCLKSGMKCVKVGTYLPDVYYLWLLAKPGTPVAEYVAKWRQQVAPAVKGNGTQTPPNP